MKEQKDDPKTGILFCILNHNNDNSNLWLYRLTERGYDAYVIDSGSDKQIKHERILNFENIFWFGSFKIALYMALKKNYKWLLTVDGDIYLDIKDFEFLLERLEKIYNTTDIGVYRPSTVEGSHCIFKDNLCKNTKKMRTVPEVEGYFMAIKQDILKKIEFMLGYDFPHNFGWGIDSAICRISMENGLKVVVDDNVKMYHPDFKASYVKDDGTKAADEHRLMLKIFFSNTFNEHKAKINELYKNIIKK